MVASAALMNPLMTGYAERHQVALIVRAAVGERSNMMHECRENVSALLFALLAERIPRQVSITNPAPCSAVPLVLIVATGKMLVMSLHDFLVGLTVTAFSIRQVRAARHAAGTFRLSRHRFTSIAA
ncbi:hypothetical protein HMPREF9162_1716 [Selenomonas sp. oral taxon 137 str. F0430]|nr:hypothetical protein HMPREF9162_1716 [Selenomonas sp. oral taxon 137 str. F0430]